jgi:hypothetical protein
MEIDKNIKYGTFDEIKEILNLKIEYNEKDKKFEEEIEKEVEKVSQNLIDSVKSKHPVLGILFLTFLR